MAEKILNTRIQLKYDTYENWTKTEVAGQGANLVLKEGEVGICAIPAGTTVNGIKNPPHVMMKIGDGVTPFASLNWLSGRAADVEDWAKAETKPAYSAQEITGIGDYIDKYVSEQMGIQVDTDTQYQIVKVDDNHYKLQSKGKSTDAVWADVVGSEIVIPESTKVEASTTNGNIKVDDEEVKVFDDVFKAEGKTVVAAGGIAAGSTVNGKTFQQILYNMMFPYQKPTISASASPNGGTYMKGNKQTITSVTATVTKKTEEIDKVELYNGSTLVATKNGDETLSSSSTSLVKNGGAVKFEGLSREVSSNGGQYKAKVYDITGGTAEANTSSFTFINPYYYGVCGASAELNEALIEGLTQDLSGRASKTYSYTTNSQRMVIAYPKSYGVIKLVKDGNGLDNTGAFGSPVTVNITNEYGVAEDYYVYANGVTSGSAKMTFSY